MPGGLGPRFIFEAAFLLLLAVGTGLANLSTRTIVIVMAVAWALVAAIEWIVWRDRARYLEQGPYAWRADRLAPPWPEERQGDPHPQIVGAPPPQPQPPQPPPGARGAAGRPLREAGGPPPPRPGPARAGRGGPHRRRPAAGGAAPLARPPPRARRRRGRARARRGRGERGGRMIMRIGWLRLV